MDKKLKISFWILIIFSFVPLAVAEESLPPLPPGPLILTSVKPEQLSPDYWINQLPDPDRLIKTDKELETFNEDIRAMVKDQVNIFDMAPVREGPSVREQIELEYNTVKGRILFGADDADIPKSLFENEIKPLLQWETIPDRLTIRWGAAARATSVRALPSDVKMLEEKGDIEFDQLQFTLIKLWTPVAVYHESSDGKWFYVQASYARGWVKAQDIALFPNQDELKKYSKSDYFLVVTGESIPLFADPDLQEPIQSLSMGTVLPLAAKTESNFAVWIPAGKAYVDLKADVSTGFLPFTQRNIIREAFKLLGSRYGWGGTYNGRDCSGFTQDIFLTVGVDMPRGSKTQAFVGTQLGWFIYKEDAEAKTETLKSALPGLTILRMPHHMMIYLGQVNGQFYVIHCTWAERYSMTSDAKNRINQVVVSDLTLNGQSYLGSLFDRIISINEVD